MELFGVLMVSFWASWFWVTFRKKCINDHERLVLLVCWEVTLVRSSQLVAIRGSPERSWSVLDLFQKERRRRRRSVKRRLRRRRKLKPGWNESFRSQWFGVKCMKELDQTGEALKRRMIGVRRACLNNALGHLKSWCWNDSIPSCEPIGTSWWVRICSWIRWEQRKLGIFGNGDILA